MARLNNLKNIVAYSAIALGSLAQGCAGEPEKVQQKSPAQTEQGELSHAEYGFTLRYTFEGNARELFREGLYWEARAQGKDITALTEQYRGDLTAFTDKNGDYVIDEPEAKSFRDASKANAMKTLNLNHLKEKPTTPGKITDN